jgi:hypothetical protein
MRGKNYYRHQTKEEMMARRFPHGVGPEGKAMAERLIEIGFKKLAMKYHPDLGGSQEEMTRLNEVRRRLHFVFGRSHEKPDIPKPAKARRR